MLKWNVMSSGTAHTMGETLYAEAVCDFMFTLQALSLAANTIWSTAAIGSYRTLFD